MTVIAYSAKHGVMATDSRCSDEHSMHLTSCKKLFRLKNGALLGTAGDDDDRLMRALLDKATPRNMPSREAIAATRTSFHGILVFPKGQVFVIFNYMHEYGNSDEWTGGVSPITDDIVAVGHGQQYAYGAMEAGADPITAVRAACRRDLTCALPIQHDRLTPLPKK